MESKIFDPCVIWLIGIAVLPMIICLLANNFFRITKKRKFKKIQKQMSGEKYQDLITFAERKVQAINKQVEALDRCSKDIEMLTETLDKKTGAFIYALQERLKDYRETACILKEIDESIQNSVSTIQGSRLISSIEALTEILDKKADRFVNAIEKSTSDYEGTAGRLRRIESNIHLSATSISKSAVLLEKRDRELKDEVSLLLSLEGKTESEIDFLLRSYKKHNKNKFGLQFNHESELAFYLDYPVDILPIPQMAKSALKVQLKCDYLEDVLSVMLLQHRKGMLSNTRNIGRKSIGELEDYLCEIGLLTVKDRHYTSQLSI